jgi:hypothetical protein
MRRHKGAAASVQRSQQQSQTRSQAQQNTVSCGDHNQIAQRHARVVFLQSCHGGTQNIIRCCCACQPTRRMAQEIFIVVSRTAKTAELGQGTLSNRQGATAVAAADNRDELIMHNNHVRSMQQCSSKPVHVSSPVSHRAYASQHGA